MPIELETGGSNPQAAGRPVGKGMINERTTVARAGFVPLNLRLPAWGFDQSRIGNRL